jgi:DNA/RNA endonuclease YhcR with UshA esterase domain
MKTIALLVSVLALASGLVFAQESKTNAIPPKIPAHEAKEHVNTEATVSGKVIELYKTEKLVRLNLDKPFPNQPFTVVMFGTKTNLFPDLDKLKGKTIEVTGKITEYRDQPQIILTSTNQLKIVEEKVEPEK